MTLDDAFCASISSSEYSGATSAVSKFVATLKVTPSNQVENFQKIKEWLEQHACVKNVEVVPGMLRVRPPIKEFLVTIDTAMGQKRKQISFRVEEKRMSLLLISDADG